MRKSELIVEAPELRLSPTLVEGPVTWDAVFGRAGSVEIEIGIGKGRFLLEAAAARPDVLHLGVEWANKYLRMAEARAVRRGLDNVRFLRADARDLMPRLPSRSVSAFYVFYPDPWPKKRHQKRRFLRPDMAAELARTLLPGARLHVATDHRGYWEALEPVFDGYEAFERCPEFGGEGFPHEAGRPLTNFEAKYIEEGRTLHHASWRRRPDS